MGRLIALWGVAVAVLLAACVPEPPERAGLGPEAVRGDFFSLGDELARQLTENGRGRMGTDRTLIFTTIVDLDDLRATSRFGRALSESLATRMFQRGYRVVELRKTADVFIKAGGGELVLTRDTARLAREHKADAIVAGTYSLTPESVIINLKLLDAGSEEVLSVAAMELERTHAVNYLLAGGKGEDVRLSGREM